MQRQYQNNFNKFLVLIAVVLPVVLVISSVGNTSGRASDQEAREHINYVLGKELFREVIVCNSCKYAELNLDGKSVQAAWRELKRDLAPKGMIGKDLRIGQRYAILFYVKKRFEIPDLEKK